MLACLGRGPPSALVPVDGAGDDQAEVAAASSLMDSIDVDITPVATPGGVLLDSSGAMLGVLGATESKSTDETGEFVPAWLAIGVAAQSGRSHEVVHGWLDVKATTGPVGGAYVVTVPAAGPAAAAGLKPGDLVIGISTSSGTAQIESMGDLRGRLYLEPPGSRIELDVLRGGQEIVLSPVLTAAHP